MRYATRAYIIITFCCGLGACHDSLSESPLLPEPADNSTTVEEPVPIVSTVSDMLYGSIVAYNAPQRHFAPGQGMGAFNSWNEDSEKWLNADFHIFAYQTANKINGQTYGGCDMTQTADIQEGSSIPTAGRTLLYDRIMRIISANGNANLFRQESDTDPTTFYYPANDQLARYKFYAYFADNAELGPIHNNASTVTRDITVNGTQDVMHAFAYHTTEDFWNRINILKQETNISSNELRMLCNPDDEGSSEQTYHNFLYSTVAAHRGFNPRFHINHLMTRLHVFVAGGSVDGDRGQTDYRNLVVTGIKFLRAKTKGTLTIANDNWDETTYQADSMNIMHWDESSVATIDCPIDTLIPYPDATYYDITKYPGIDINYPDLFKNHVHVQSSKRQELTKPVLLAPDESYTIHIDMLYANKSANQASSEIELNKDTPFYRHTVEHVLRLPENMEPSFMQGNEYYVIIYVFGLQEVHISISNSRPWMDGGTIPIDTDELSQEMEQSSNVVIGE